MRAAKQQLLIAATSTDNRSNNYLRMQPQSNACSACAVTVISELANLISDDCMRAVPMLNLACALKVSTELY
jgi:ferredoxin